MVVSVGNQVSMKSSGRIEKPDEPSERPARSRSVTRGRNVYRPIRSAANPTRNNTPRIIGIFRWPANSFTVALSMRNQQLFDASSNLMRRQRNQEIHFTLLSKMLVLLLTDDVNAKVTCALISVPS